MELRRVLIIRGDQGVWPALVKLLTETNSCEIVFARNQEATLNAVRMGAVDLVLADVSLWRDARPHGGSPGIIAALASEHECLPIVAVADAASPEAVLEVMRHGAWDCIRTLSEVLAVIRRVMTRARRLRARPQADARRAEAEIAQLNRALEAEIAAQTQDLRRQNLRLTALGRVAQAISHAPEVDTMLHRALTAVLSGVEAEAGCVQLVSPATAHLYVTTVSGLSRDKLPFGDPLPLGSESMPGRVAQDGHLRTGVREAARSPIVSPLPPGAGSYAYVPLRSSDGATLWDGTVVAGDAVVGVLSVFADHTKGFTSEQLDLLNVVCSQLGVAITRAHYAADLRRANLQLEAANAELRRLDDLREQFIQNVAHELRTPLALVSGYVDLLLEGDCLSPAQREHALRVVDERVGALVRLVESITTLQDIRTEPLDIETIRMSELVPTACRMVTQRATVEDITLCCVEAHDLPEVSGDFLCLTQALYQLLDNAIKFSGAGTRVTVTPGLSDDGRYVTVEVRDEGIGIPEAEYERIFDRFYQVDGSTSRRYGGTGLGLALVKEILEAHGGWVAVDSTPNAGSTFTMAVPLDGVPDSAS